MKKRTSGLTRKDFIGGAVSAAVLPRVADAALLPRSALSIRFLGTGAADWGGEPVAHGESRAYASVLVNGSVLVDFTWSAHATLSAHLDGAADSPRTIFYTHSHGDHYQPEAAVKLGVKRAFVHESWLEDAKRAFADRVEVRGLAFGETVEADGVRFTSLPANHATERPHEAASMYLIERGEERILYATDTAGIPAKAARIVGIDVHRKSDKVLTGLIMDATMGVGHEDDFRIFQHSSVAQVAQLVRILSETGRYRPPAGRKVYLTHLSRELHGSQSEIAAAVPVPLVPAFDGCLFT